MHFQFERLINDRKKRGFCQNLDNDIVIFDQFGGQKNRFLDFFKVLLELFSVKELFLTIKCQFLGVFSAPKIDK